MITINQLYKYKRKPRKYKRRCPALKGCPQLRGICTRVTTTSPKKPNSAVRKIARLKLSNGMAITAAIPGQGHNLQQYALSLVRGGRAKDIPGVRYKLIRGKLDLDWKETIVRQQGRSKYGIKQWEENKFKRKK